MTRIAFIALIAACDAASVTAPDAGISHNDLCCQLWQDGNAPGSDQLAFLQECSPSTPSTCTTYDCPEASQPVEVCTGTPP